MIALTLYHQKHVALFGLGKSGLATAKALMAGGAHVYAFDDDKQRCEIAKEEGIPIHDLHLLDWKIISALILSPGVPLTHPAPHWSVALAHKENCPIIGDIDLFFQQKQIDAPNAKTICITGTNGKSTTTALISHMLQYAGYEAMALGNIGNAILACAPLKDDAIYVIECSSYQIDLSPHIAPDHAILLNISPDHLDRHGTVEHYAHVKTNLLKAALHHGGRAYISTDDRFTQQAVSILKETNAGDTALTTFSTREKQGDYYVKGDIIYSIQEGELLIDANQFPALKGEHNQQNMLAAFAVGYAMALNVDVMKHAFTAFGGLAHRMEIVGQYQHIRFINDSKATNADAAEKSLICFDAIYWILGGQSKKGGIESLYPHFHRIKHAFLIGQAADEFASTLQKYNIAHSHHESLDDATQKAFQIAMQAKNEDATILLAPAAASWDQFQSFEHRGDCFKASIKDIIFSQNE